MRRLRFLALFIFLSIALSAGGGAWAMTSSANPSDSVSANNYPAPYTGGAAVAKVLHAADGSTITITATGAVIKQSPADSAYREGWISPCDIAGINSAADLVGKLASGTSNPYPGNCQPTQPTTPTTTTPTTQQTSSTSSASANATANATVNLTASTPAPAQPAARQTAASTSSGTSGSAQTSSTFSGKSLPNTGPGNIGLIGGAATVFSTIGHFLVQRLRFRALT